MGNLYISDNQNRRIRKIDPSGTISLVAGTGVVGYSGDGGPATAAMIGFTGGVWVDNTGNLFIADGTNNAIRKVDPSGIISTIAGDGSAGSTGDGGLATAARLNVPQDVFADPDGNIYIADAGNNRVRKINTSGIISTIAGTGTAGFSGDGGLATLAKLNGPDGIAMSSTGALYISEAFNNRIRIRNLLPYCGHQPRQMDQ